MKQISLTIGLVLCLSSCVREGLVDAVGLPAPQKRPAVLSILSPGDSVQVAVLWPSGINDVLKSSSVQISDATVGIQNTQNGRSVDLPLWRSGVYSISQQVFPIKPGQEYRVTISVPGQKQLTATCQVPDRAATFTVTPGGSVKKTEGGYYQRTVRLRWADVGNQYEYLVGSQNITTQWAYKLSAAPLRAIRADGWVVYDLDISHDKPTPFLANVSLMTLDRHTADLFQQLEKTRDLSTANLSQTLLGFRGILPDISNVENGEGVVGTCLRVDSVVTLN